MSILIKIEHEISDTEMEIYKFDVSLHRINYVGITWSNRDSKEDIWGHKYEDYLLEKFSSEIEKLNNMVDEGMISYEDYREEIDTIFVPQHTKTIHGKTRQSGSFGGKNPEPKIDLVELKKLIIDKLNYYLEKSELKL
jgi:hypothetical protein